jgi:hypothetical protein
MLCPIEQDKRWIKLLSFLKNRQKAIFYWNMYKENIPDYFYSDPSIISQIPESSEEVTNPSEAVPIKPAIEELFDSTPELANQVYKALGFNQSTFDTKEITLSKETSIGWMFIQLNNKKIGRVKFVNNGEKGQLGLSIEINDEYQSKGYGQIVHTLMADLAKKDYKSNLYSDYQNSSQEIQLLNSLVKKGYAEKIGDIGKASKEYPDSFVTEERAFRIKTSDEIQQITPQQKQQAISLYSQYLDTIFPDSKVKDIVYHGKNEGNSLDLTLYEKDHDIYFAPSKEEAEYWGGRPGKTGYLKKNTNPETFNIMINGRDANLEEKKEYLKKLFEIKITPAIINNPYSGITQTDDGRNLKEYSSKPEQIHILGSKRDIEGFKEFVSKKEVEGEKNNLTTHAKVLETTIKEQLPKEIADTITILETIPEEILGRDDLYLAMKDVLEANGITDPALINWLGINKGNKHPKNFTSEDQVKKLIEDTYNELLKQEYAEFKKNPIAKESYEKWKAALEKYPTWFKHPMLKHAIKYLNPQRRDKFVLQLSETALQNTYGLVIGKPHELNRIGKLYDKEVLAVVAEAGKHERSASGRGYWVHVPRTQQPLSDEGLVSYSEILKGLKDPSLIKTTFLYKNIRYFVEDNKIKKLLSDLTLSSEEVNLLIKDIENELTKAKNSQFKANVELLRKLSPATWCTATYNASYYVENFDNYILIVDGVTVVGIEAYPSLIKARFTRNENDSTYEKTFENEESLYEYAKKTNEEFVIQQSKKEVKEVTSVNNNGIASIDHLEDTIAFFEKHGLDTNNSTIQAAIKAKESGGEDKDFTYAEDNGDLDEYYNLAYGPYAEIEDRAAAINTLEEARTFLFERVGGTPNTEFYYALKPEFQADYELAKFTIEQSPQMIGNIESELPFYLELAKLAMQKDFSLFQYLTVEAKADPDNIAANEAFIVERNRRQAIYLQLPEQQKEEVNLIVNNLDGTEEEKARILDQYTTREILDTLNKYINIDTIQTLRLKLNIEYLPLSKTNENRIQGYYDATNDKVVIIAANVKKEEAAKVAIHEVAHRGMLRMAKELGGVKQLHDALIGAEQELIKKLPELLKRTGHTSLENLMIDYGFDKDSREGKTKLLMELAARWAETLVDKPKPTWWVKLLQKLGDWLKIFTGKTLTEDEVNSLVGGFVKYGSKKKENNSEESESGMKALPTLSSNKSPVYSAVFVDTNVLIQKYGQVYENLYSHHSTIEFKPKDISNLPIGDPIEIKIIGRLTTDKLDVLLVDNPLSKNKYPHITLSTINGIRPVESNSEIEKNQKKIKPLNDSIEGIIGYSDGVKKITTPLPKKVTPAVKQSIINRINSFNTLEELNQAWESPKFTNDQKAEYKEYFTKRKEVILAYMKRAEDFKNYVKNNIGIFKTIKLGEKYTEFEAQITGNISGGQIEVRTNTGKIILVNRNQVIDKIETSPSINVELENYVNSNKNIFKTVILGGKYEIFEAQVTGKISKGKVELKTNTGKLIQASLDQLRDLNKSTNNKDLSRLNHRLSKFEFSDELRVLYDQLIELYNYDTNKVHKDIISRSDVMFQPYFVNEQNELVGVYYYESETNPTFGRFAKSLSDARASFLRNAMNNGFKLNIIQKYSPLAKYYPAKLVSFYYSLTEDQLKKIDSMLKKEGYEKIEDLFNNKIALISEDDIIEILKCHI